MVASMSNASTHAPPRSWWTLRGCATTNAFKAKMNRFLTKKRAKKAPAQPKVELDLSNVLPSDDNFRTSLLMPGLSTRFSMLREQDDPHSMLGKASDDSVLMPNRRSRLYNFGYSPSHLGDIAEVSSLNGSVRPNFDPGRRQDSFASADGYGTDDESLRSGSMMSRSRPGEGNVLFGGRQKIYKIPVSAQSERSLSGSSKGGMGGRALYEDDVNVTSFQQYKRQERERMERELQAAQGAEHDSPSKHSTPALSTYNTKRETSSSTTSGQNARTSTAATSITSQGPNAVSCASPGLSSSFNISQPPSAPSERSATKGKRLYEQGLDRDMQDQHANTLNRLNSVQKGRNGLGIPFMSARSTPNLQERYQRGAASGTASPVPHGFSPLESPVKEYSPQDRPYSPVDSRPISPMSHAFEDHSILSTAIDPNDRGKATAMGLFNKPKQYTETEYLQRQKSLLQGRSTPTHGRASPNLAREPQQPRKPAPLAVFKEEPTEPVDIGRSRSPTDSSMQSEKHSFNFFQNTTGQGHHNMEGTSNSASATGHPAFASPRDSEVEADGPLRTAPFGFNEGPRTMKKADLPNARLAPPPPRNNHPAFRPNSPFERPDEPLSTANSPLEGSNGFSSVASAHGPHAVTSNNAQTASADHAPSGSLSGMVSQHLRSNSDKSSIYDLQQTNGNGPVHPNAAQTYSYGQGPYSYGQGPPQSKSATNHPSYASSNPWDLDVADGSRDASIDNHVSLSEPGIGWAMSKPDDAANGMKPIPEPSWEDQMHREHARGPSVETTAERHAIENELAERQRTIQEKLKTKASGELRSTSPTPTKSNGFKNMLRSKTSRDSMAERAEQSRAKKLLALGGGSSSNLPALTARRSEEEKMNLGKYGVPLPPEPEDTMPGAEFRTRDRSASRGTKGKSPPASARSSAMTTRNRSDSDLSGGPGGRSRSRGPKYKDDLDRAMAEGTSSRTVSMYPESVYSNADILEENPLPPPVPQIQSGYASPRLRSNSKTNSPAPPQGQWEQGGLHPAMRSPNGAAPSPQKSPGFGHLDTSMANPNFLARPSPSSAQSPAFSPAGRSPILAQGSYSGSHTPVSAHTPISGATTPVYPPTSFAAMQAAMPQQTPGQASQRAAQRKRSVMKHEISEPTLISTTSVVDTVNLPPGASLKNGQDELAPPVPPINPRRKKFGFGRSGENTPVSSTAASPRSESPPREQQTSFFEEDDVDRSSGRSRSRSRLRKQASDGKNLAERSRKEREFEQENNTLPVISSPQVLHHPIGSPPIVMEGGMF